MLLWLPPNQRLSHKKRQHNRIPNHVPMRSKHKNCQRSDSMSLKYHEIITVSNHAKKQMQERTGQFSYQKIKNALQSCYEHKGKFVSVKENLVLVTQPNAKIKTIVTIYSFVQYNEIYERIEKKPKNYLEEHKLVLTDTEETTKTIQAYYSIKAQYLKLKKQLDTGILLSTQKSESP